MTFKKDHQAKNEDTGTYSRRGPYRVDDGLPAAAMGR